MTNYSVDHTARNEEIYQLRLKGWTLKLIGDRYGISKERVRILLMDAWREKKRPLGDVAKIAPRSTFERDYCK